MSASSRRPEIKRRQARKDKINKLRQRFAKARSSEEKDRLFEKVKAMSPLMTRDAFAGIPSSPKKAA